MSMQEKEYTLHAQETDGHVRELFFEHHKQIESPHKMFDAMGDVNSFGRQCRKAVAKANIFVNGTNDFCRTKNERNFGL